MHYFGDIMYKTIVFCIIYDKKRLFRRKKDMYLSFVRCALTNISMESIWNTSICISFVEN